MMIENFEITKVFEITARNMFVLTGNLLKGIIEGNTFLIDDDNNIRISVNSVEMINSKDNSGLIALTFLNMDQDQLYFLKSLKKGSVVSIQ